MFSGKKIYSYLILFLITFCFFCFSNLEAQFPTFSLCDSKGVPLDHKLIKTLGEKRNGIFVEVGAYDGVNQSNTKLLEDYFGWTGILIEPSEILHKSISANRPNCFAFKCALGSFKEDNTYVYGDFDGYSPMNSVYGSRLKRPANKRALVRSLQSILDETKITHVDFFSLDTEGYEYNILQGIDFKKTTFDFLLIETYPNEHQLIVNFLAEKGYDLVENYSNYNKKENPRWDGTHNDFLFKRRDLSINQ